MWICVFALGLAWGQGLESPAGDAAPPDAPATEAGALPETIQITFAVDDREISRLKRPMLRTSVGPVALLDDGSRVGDAANDGVWFGVFEIPRSDTVSFTFEDGSLSATVSSALPNAPTVHLAYKTWAGDPPIVVDLKAPAPPEGSGRKAEGVTDTIAVDIAVDDRVFQRLVKPQVEIPGAQGFADLVDDGSHRNDSGGDRIWWASVDVQRAQYLNITIRDQGEPIGTLQAFLPSSGGALLKLKTLEGLPGVQLSQEAVSTLETLSPEESAALNAPTGGALMPEVTDVPLPADGSSASGGAMGAAGTASVGPPGAGGPPSAGAPPGGGTVGAVVTDSRFSHVLWVALAMFAMAFGWVRHSVWKTWTTEVRPMVRRMDQFLNQAGVPALEDLPPLGEE